MFLLKLQTATLKKDFEKCIESYNCCDVNTCLSKCVLSFLLKLKKYYTNEYVLRLILCYKRQLNSKFM